MVKKIFEMKSLAILLVSREEGRWRRILLGGFALFKLLVVLSVAIL